MDFFKFFKGPVATATVIKTLIFFTAIIALSSVTIQMVMDGLDFLTGPQEVLSLSSRGLSKGYIWQLFTYLFIESHEDALSLPYLFILFSSLYLLWIIGSAALEFIEDRFFLPLYLTSGIISGLIATITMSLFREHTALTGIEAPLLTFFTIWGIGCGNVEFLLFPTVPVKIKWLTAIFLCSVLLIHLSGYSMARFMLSLSAIVIGYLFAICFLRLQAPFRLTLFFDQWVIQKSAHLKNLLPKKFQQMLMPSIKNELSDEAFIQAMIDKISKTGEESLTWKEELRLQQITAKKK